MATISNDPLQVAHDGRSWPRFLVAEMWTSLAISVIWVTVLLDALFGPDIRTTSAGGDSSVSQVEQQYSRPQRPTPLSRAASSRTPI